jgi:23S rRNA pseudouridine2605 synthase
MRDHPTKDRHSSRGASPSRGTSRSGAAKGAPKAAAARTPPAKRPPRAQKAEPKSAREPAAAVRQPRKKITLKAPPRETSGETAGAAQRIAKVMARAGACSRRDAEAWIGEGRVALNGVALTDPAINVDDHDRITIDGEPLAARARTRLFLFHKPRGLVTTERDPEGRPTIFDYLREHWPQGPRVVSIGRLDINTEGLLLLTNDGGLARILELPSTGWVRRYRVRAKGDTDQGVLDRLRTGVSIDGIDYAGIEAVLDREQGANSWLTMGLREGKNREIKRVLEHIGLVVNRLIRLSFGPFQLGELSEGAVEEVRTRVLRDQLGPSLAEAAGADFLGPVGDVAEAPERLSPAPRQAARTGARPERDDGRSRRMTRGAPDGDAQRRGQRQPRPSAPEPRAEAKVKPAPGPRKHISALRAEERAEPGGPRKRIERRETADRSGRTVHVERLVAAESRDARRSKAPQKRQDARQDSPNPPTTRNGRRFEAERKDREGRGARPERRAGGAAPTEGSRGPKREGRPRRTDAGKASAFAAREGAPARSPASARYSAASPGGRDRPKTGASGDRAFAPKRYDERSRPERSRPERSGPARGKDKAEGGRSPRPGRPAGGGKSSGGGPRTDGGGRPGGGQAGAGGGRSAPRSGGAGKSRPRGK